MINAYMLAITKELTEKEKDLLNMNLHIKNFLNKYYVSLKHYDVEIQDFLSSFYIKATNYGDVIDLTNARNLTMLLEGTRISIIKEKNRDKDKLIFLGDIVWSEEEQEFCEFVDLLIGDVTFEEDVVNKIYIDKLLSDLKEKVGDRRYEIFAMSFGLDGYNNPKSIYAIHRETGKKLTEINITQKKCIRTLRKLAG